MLFRGSSPPRISHTERRNRVSGGTYGRTMTTDLRQRLREAVHATGRKHSDIAWGAGISPVTLSRILNAPHPQPAFLTVVRLAHELGVTAGWLLDEEGFQLDAQQRAILRDAAQLLLTVT